MVRVADAIGGWVAFRGSIGSKGTRYAMQPLGLDDPRRIGDYRLLGVLGAGGMGRVYLGRSAGGRTVAVKVIRPDLVADPEFRTRFQREVAAARRVGSSCTAPVLDADVAANPPWLATGYVAGLALSDAVERFGPLGEHSLLVLAHGLAEALIAVHAAGVVHRDLKPSNVLLALDGPKVIDFGIARAMDDTSLTTTGKVIGSPAFMSPEQVTGEPIGPAGDMFALGGVLAYAAAGQGPFGTGDTVQLLWRVVYEEPRIEAVPPRLRPVVAACLAKNPADRPTPRQVLDQLTALGLPDRAGWLPAPVLEDVSARAVRLLDLDSEPDDGYGEPTRAAAIPSGHGTAPAHPGTARYPQDDPYRQSSGGYGTAAGQGTGAQPEPGRYGTTPTGWHTHTAHSGSDRSVDRNHSVPQGYSAHSPHGRQHGSGAGRTDATALHRPSTAHEPSTRRSGRRGPLVAALVVVGTAVAAGAFVIGTQLRDQPPHENAGAPPSAQVAEPTETAPTTTAATSTTTAPESAVPAEFVGTWRGTAADGLVAFDIELVIDEGEIGTEVARSANTGKLIGQRCSRVERLTEANPQQLTFVGRLADDSPRDCRDEGAVTTVRLQPDGSLAYSTPGLFGGSIAGILRRG